MGQPVLIAVRGDGALRTGIATLNGPKQFNALIGVLMDDPDAAQHDVGRRYRLR